MNRFWDGATRLPIAVLVDVDGTLGGVYVGGERELRATAIQGLRLLAAYAPVFLWSIAGADNGDELLREFPELRSLIQGAYGKDEFPLDRVDRAYAIDDEALDEAVLRCHFLALTDTYFGGADSGRFLDAVGMVIADMEASGRIAGDSNPTGAVLHPAVRARARDRGPRRSGRDPD